MENKIHASGLTLVEVGELREQAQAAAAQAYAPYSGFRVGAAVLLWDGSIFTGCNVENASYRMTLCAEHTAIARAVAEKGPGISIRAVSVANLNGAASMPCGPCRQVILEFGRPETWVFGPGEEGHVVETTLGELLPHGFRLSRA